MPTQLTSSLTLFKPKSQLSLTTSTSSSTKSTNTIFLHQSLATSLMYISCAYTKTLSTNQNYTHLLSPLPFNASLQATLPTPSAKSLPVTCSLSTMLLVPQMEAISSSTPCNYRLRNTFHNPNLQAPFHPAQLSSLTSPINSTVSPARPSLMSSLNLSLKSSPSLHSSTNMLEQSITSGLMAHGIPS